jgi:hypothetical protein
MPYCHIRLIASVRPRCNNPDGLNPMCSTATVVNPEMLDNDFVSMAVSDHECVALCTILLEGSMAPENIVSSFESYEHYSVDVSSMIDCSILEYNERYYSFGTGSQSDHLFREKRSFPRSKAYPIHCGTTSCPHTIILRVVDTIDVQSFFVQKQGPCCLLIWKICSNTIYECFPRRDFRESDETNSMIFFLPMTFEIFFFSFPFFMDPTNTRLSNVMFTERSPYRHTLSPVHPLFYFLCTTLDVRMILGQSIELNSSMVSFSLIDWHHLLTVVKANPMLESSWSIIVGPCPLCYFARTNFRRSLFYMI